MTNSFLTENLNKNQSEVLVNVNQTQEIEFQKASEEIKKGLVSDNSFAISIELPILILFLTKSRIEVFGFLGTKYV
ncbi:hypothetical protein M4K87_12955 [Staphylococcus equorum]|uniref:hypothetical protein n=1 Tax=Staphylococcus equorum TaxID=246432 RepID=UPI002407AAAE|nr:hypothetical protein [Staphylococcus equorum]MDG0826352.1 hypothetical protein [Staphylococcus equorum]